MKRRDLFKAIALTAIAPVAIGKILAKPTPFKGFGEWQEPLIGHWGGLPVRIDDMQYIESVGLSREYIYKMFKIPEELHPH